MSCATQHVEEVHNVLSVMQKTLECPICLDLMKEPVATRCDHIFCRFCMFQLLSRKKKGRVQCPMCKQEVTKRSLQESPRFKLLIDGLMKIIGAFEQDSGYKFFPSQDHAKNILTICQENKEEQTVVESKGYRKRKSTVNGGQRADHTILLQETFTDTLPKRDAEKESCSRFKRKKQATHDDKSKRLLITEFVSDYSEEDLFKKAGSFGNGSRSYPLNELGKDDDSAKSQDEDLKICENNSLKPETDEVVASDLAEYGFSERDLESTRSNLLCMEGAGAGKETPAKKRSSSKDQEHLILDCDIANKSERSLLWELAKDPVHSEDNGQTGSTIQKKKHVRDERQSLKIAIDNQYDKDDSVLEEIAYSQTSTQTTPRRMSNAVPRKRLKRSIQRVNEWLQKTSEFLNAAPWDEDLLSEVFPELDVDDEVSDKDSCLSGETEIMTAFYPSTLLDAVEKPVNVQDKIFGKVYKREKKSNIVPKITVVASVHVDGNADSRKIKEIPKRLTSGLQPKVFIRRVETTEENSYTEDGNLLVANEILLNDKNESNQDSDYLDNDITNPKETKLGTRKIPLKRASESPLTTRTRQSLLLIKSSDLIIDKDGPFNHSVITINTYPSSNESGHEDNQRNVRRSKRLNLSKKAGAPPIKKLIGTNDKRIKNIDPDGVLPITETTFQTPQMCTFNGSNDQIITMLSPNGKVAPFVKKVEINPPHPECETSDGGVKELENKQTDTKRNALWTEDIDSDADTHHLIKAFKSAKRMSFKLDHVSDIDKHSDAINPPDSKTNLPNSCLDEITLTMPDKQEVIHATNAILSSGYQERNSVESEVIVLSSENETRQYPIITHESPSPVRREHTRSVTIQGENEHVKTDFYRKHSFHEEQVNQIASDNSSQGSVAKKLLESSLSHQNSSLKSPDIYSDTPDGLLCFADRPGEEPSCAEAEKSFVFAKEQKVVVSGGSKSSINESQLIKRKKQRAQKLESSEEESSEDEELPCFNKFLFGNTSNSACQKNASSDCSPKQQGGGVLAMFSSCSTSGKTKTQTSLNVPKETLASQESVNLFSSQSNTSDNSTNVAIEQELEHNQVCHKNSQTKKDYFFKNGLVQEDYEIAAADFYEDPSKQQHLDEVSECESEASQTGDSSGLSSQCDVFSTQQRDALRNNLEKLQEEMAALESALEQHSTASPSSKKGHASTAELNTMRLQEAYQKQTNHDVLKSLDAVPETEVQSERSDEHPVPFVIGSGSPTPPPSPSQTKSKKETPEKVHSTFMLLKALKENAHTQEESNNVKQLIECSSSTKEPDTCKPQETNLNQATVSPRRSLRSSTQGKGAFNKISSHKRHAADIKQQSQKQKANSNTNRSSSPTFTSPTRSRTGSASSKIPVIPNRRNFSLVASGLNHSELILVQKFARKTQSIFSVEMSDSITHVVMKTDEYLVCERTLKYFLGIAGRKWVVSYDWIVQSFREGRILDEYDFEVKGDVINGRNHRGPRRSRLGSDGLLLSDFEICCLGSFKDMTRENLECIVSLCGASLVKEPQMLKHKEGTTSLVVVQSDGKTDYAAMQKKYHALVITREWILDSVSSYKLQTLDGYLM